MMSDDIHEYLHKYKNIAFSSYILVNLQAQYATTGGRSHFFRLRLRSCSKIFESGSGNASNLRIRIPFRLWPQSLMQP